MPRVRTPEYEGDGRREDDFRVRGPFGLNLHANGPNAMMALLIVTCFAGLVVFGYFHHKDQEDKARDQMAASQVLHTQQLQALERIDQRFGEMSYILAQPQEKREKLDIAMPDSLRARIRHKRDE